MTAAMAAMPKWNSHTVPTMGHTGKHSPDDGTNTHRNTVLTMGQHRDHTPTHQHKHTEDYDSVP